MICKGCGKVIEDWNYTCPFCGSKTQADDETKKTTSETTNETTSEQNEKTTENVKTRPNYFVSDDEVEIIRAKWTIIPFIFVWIVYFIVLFGSKSAFYASMKNAQANIDKSIIELAFLLFLVISALVCLISLILFLLRRELVVTNKKVYGRLGLIGTKQFIVPIKKINYIDLFYCSLLLADCLA